MSKQHAVDFFVDAMNRGDLKAIQSKIWGYSLDSVWTDSANYASVQRAQLEINRRNAENLERGRSEINDLKQQVSDIRKTEQQKNKIAKQILQKVDGLAQEVEKLSHQRFASGKLNRLKTTIENNRASVNTMSEGVWANLTGVWQDLWDLKAEITVKESKFKAKYDFAISACAEILKKAAENNRRNMEFPDEAGNKQSKEIDIDYWSFGALREYEERVKSMQTVLVNSENDLSFTLENLDELLKRIAQEQPELGNIIMKAGNNVAASQIRFDIAEIGANVLLDQLFDPDTVKATYEGSDPRGGYIMQMENKNGTKATIVVSPSEDKDEQGKFKLTINFENDDDYISADEIRSRSERIEQNILQDARLCGAEKVGNSKCTNIPDTSFSNIEEVKRRSSEQLKTIRIK